ncbi:MAG: hypothetical protein CMN30_11065 [Sandaracinus sp.]|nr:hypothetical protein [Sandaracinus sp.]
MSAVAPVGAPAREREPTVAVVSRLLVHALGAAIFAAPLVRGEATALAALGAALGAGLAPRFARGPWRTGGLVTLGVALLALGFLGRFLFVDTAIAARGLGPAAALRTGDGWLFAFGAAGVSFALRSLSARRRSLAALEVVAVAAAFMQLVVAHRHGAINRPFEIADPIIAAGGDPTHVFYAVGALAALAVVLLLLAERSVWRSLLHLAAVLLVLGLVFGLTDALDPPAPPVAGAGLGLRPGEGEPQEGEGGQGNQRGQGGEQRPDENLEFQDDLDTSQSQVPVAVVLFHSDYSSPTGVYYFRQGAFSQYNGRRMVGATGGLDRDLGDAFPSRTYTVPDPPLLNQNRTSVETTVALLTEHNRPFGLEAPVRFAPARNPDPRRFDRLYRVESAVLTSDFFSMIGARAGAKDWGPEEWTHYTEGPEDPRYAALAQRILDEKLPDYLRGDPAAQVAAVTSWLAEQGTYSLRSRHADADDPTADFLFGDVTGYCVHFAHAGAYLLRSLGLPARVATGYAVDEAQRAGGSALLISGETSHAWPEVRIEGFGWVVADISPQNVISPPPAPSDQDLQRLLGELARGLEAMPIEPETPLVQQLERAFDWMKLSLLGLLWFLGLVLAALFGGKLWRRLAPRFADPAAQPRVAYRADLDRLSDVGIRRRRGESRESFAARVAEALPALVPLTRAHVGAAFGSRRRPDLGSHRSELRQQLRQAVPLWRRLLGAIDPFSWLLTR